MSLIEILKTKKIKKDGTTEDELGYSATGIIVNNNLLKLISLAYIIPLVTLVVGTLLALTAIGIAYTIPYLAILKIENYTHNKSQKDKKIGINTGEKQDG